MRATAWVMLGLLAGGAQAAPLPDAHWAMLDDYCVKCHNTTDWAGEMALDAMGA